MLRYHILIGVVVGALLVPMSGYSQNSFLHVDSSHKQNFQPWPTEYLGTQSDYDIIQMGNNASIKDWHRGDSLRLALLKERSENGCGLEFMTSDACSGYSASAQAQGQRTAFKTINANPDDNIPMSQNGEGNLTANYKPAETAEAKLPGNYLRKTVHVIEYRIVSL